MSDKIGAPRPSRSGSGLILSGLAVGAILSTPVAAAAVTGAAESVVAASACAQEAVASETSATDIREQFGASFIAGAVTPPTTDHTAIICEPE